MIVDLKYLSSCGSIQGVPKVTFLLNFKQIDEEVYSYFSISSMVIARYLLNLFSRSKALGTSCVSPPPDGRFAASLPRTHCKLCGFCPQAGHGDHLALDITTQTKAQGVSQGGRRAHSMGPLRAIHPPGNLMTRKSLTDMANLGGPPAC